jgi:hypothetical protein
VYAIVYSALLDLMLHTHAYHSSLDHIQFIHHAATLRKQDRHIKVLQASSLKTSLNRLTSLPAFIARLKSCRQEWYPPTPSNATLHVCHESSLFALACVLCKLPFMPVFVHLPVPSTPAPQTAPPRSSPGIPGHTTAPPVSSPFPFVP